MISELGKAMRWLFNGVLIVVVAILLACAAPKLQEIYSTIVDGIEAVNAHNR